MMPCKTRILCELFFHHVRIIFHHLTQWDAFSHLLLHSHLALGAQWRMSFLNISGKPSCVVPSLAVNRSVLNSHREWVGEIEWGRKKERDVFLVSGMPLAGRECCAITLQSPARQLIALSLQEGRRPYDGAKFSDRLYQVEGLRIARTACSKCQK